MKVLVIGSGGREHTLVWKIAQSPKIDRIYCAPGNAGIAENAECIDIKVEDTEGLCDFAAEERIDLTVVGPEAPLVNGIVDLFESRGLRIFGPRKEAAILEGSKVFSKEMMVKYGAPTSKARIFTDSGEAKSYLHEVGAPIVVKADGLSAGKGSIVCGTIDEAEKAVRAIMEEKIFGESGDRILVEECLFGEEASFIVFTDGKNIVPMVSSQDHKRVFDGDKGLNTGGMGAYSPAPVVTKNLEQRIMDEIIRPIISGMAKEGRPYKGVLYAGIMVTNEGPKVIEFNVRYGDPENQVIMPRLKEDLVDIMEAIIDGKLTRTELDWDERACVCVVLASGGYPGKYEKGKEISGLEEAKKMEDVVVFHAGTKLQKMEERTKEEKPTFITNGGRVFGVTAMGKDIKSAIDRVYEVVENIRFDGLHYRKDIGCRAIKGGIRG